MPVIVKRSDPVYIASIFLAFTLWLGVTVSISKTVSWEKAWKFAMHPLLNSAGVFFMTIGILEQSTRRIIESSFYSHVGVLLVR